MAILYVVFCVVVVTIVSLAAYRAFGCFYVVEHVKRAKLSETARKSFLQVVAVVHHIGTIIPLLINKNKCRLNVCTLAN
jgi:hypothetical protein